MQDTGKPSEVVQSTGYTPASGGTSSEIFYREAQQETEAALNQRKGSIKQFVILRTVSFLLMLFAFAAAWDGRRPLAIAGVACLVWFFLLVRRHHKVVEIIDHLESRLAVIDWYLARIDGSWSQTRTAKPAAAGGADSTAPADRDKEKADAKPRTVDDDTLTDDDEGSDFLRDDLPQGVDLHLFGKSSLFQYISTAVTKDGREKLARALAPAPTARETIKRRQEAAAELIGKRDFMLSLLELSALLPPKHDTRPLADAVTGKTAELRLPRVLLWLRFLPILSFLSLFAAAFSFIPWTVPEVLFLLNLVIASASYPFTSAAFAPIAQAAEDLSLYEKLFERIEAHEFTSAALRDATCPLREPADAVHGLKRLACIGALASERENLFFFLIFNMLFLWDFHVLSAYGKWQEVSGRHLHGWLSVWSDFELYLSLATIGATRKTWLFPTIEESEAPVYEAESLTTPLIDEHRATPNDARLTGLTTIITGSNMSGKTTYLRTIGLSAVLAYAGAPVCAKVFRISPMRIFTSIQVNDDLSQGISTFYAEILRIKQMVEFARGGLPMLALIDEIFKGTNSADRIYGAEETLKRLAKPWCITLVTTHDFELCDMETAGEVENCHFEEHYEDGKILFDYTRKEGRCHTTNAKYLLKMAGITEE